MMTNEGWAAAEMKGARLDDARRRGNLIRICERLAEQPGKSLSAALGPALRQASHRLCSEGDLTPADLIAGHVEQTVRRAVAAGGTVIVAQDTCRLDYFTHRATTGLGPIGNEPNSRGLFAHSALALLPDGQPLGLLHLSVWARDPEQYGRRERRKKVDVSEKESQKWRAGLRAVEAALPPEVPVVLVQDREADAYEFFAMKRRGNTHLIVRGYLPRRAALLPEGEIPPEAACLPDTHLDAAWEQAPVRARASVSVAPRGKQKAREAQVLIRSAPVRIWRSQNLPADADVPPTVDVWAVWVREVDPPENVEALSWLLITTLSAQTAPAAREVVNCYRLRWSIERLHYVAKSGLQVERLQLDDADSLKRALALYWVVAWRLLALTYWARSDPDAPAASWLSEAEQAVLAVKFGAGPRTMREAVRAVARLGGWEGYPSAGEPGVKSLWQGLRDLERLAQGWQMAKQYWQHRAQSYEPS
jgi:hypothetical protein